VQDLVFRFQPLFRTLIARTILLVSTSIKVE